MELSEKTIKEKIQTDYGFAIKCLLIVYDNQRNDEKQIKQTKYHNNVGFNGTDAEFLSDCAERVIRWRQETEHQFPAPLSPRQMECVRKSLPKYWKQISNHFSSLESTETKPTTTEPEHKNNGGWYCFCGAKLRDKKPLPDEEHYTVCENCGVDYSWGT